MNINQIIMSSLSVAQIAATLRDCGYEGRDEDLVGTEATFLRTGRSSFGTTYSYRTKFYDTNEECWCYGGLVLTLQADGMITGDYTGQAVPIRTLGATKS